MNFKGHEFGEIERLLYEDLLRMVLVQFADSLEMASLNLFQSYLNDNIKQF